MGAAFPVRYRLPIASPARTQVGYMEEPASKMQELTPVQTAAMTGGAALLFGGVVGLRHAYGPHPRRVVQAKIDRAGSEHKRLTEVAQRTRRARRHHMISEPANVRVVTPAAAREEKTLDVSTMEELLAGLFSLRGDLTALAKELEGLRETDKLVGAA
jgi:hypothetical protein